MTVASNRGYKMQPVKDRGRWWMVPSGTWMHQMCYLAIDDDPSRPGGYQLNSWSKTAHLPPQLREAWESLKTQLRAYGTDGGAVKPATLLSALADDLGCPIGPGGWVDAETMDYQFRQNDSFVVSFVDGFPEQNTECLLI